jgi:hypothetical protein
MIHLEIVSENLLMVKSDMMVVPLFHDIFPIKGSVGRIDWLMNNRISHYVLSQKILGNYLERGIICLPDKFIANKILLIGMGNSTTFDVKRVNNISSALIDILTKVNIFDFSLELLGKGVLSHEPESVLGEMIAGFVKRNPDTLITIRLAEEDKAVRKNLLKKARAVIPEYKKAVKLI